MNPTGWNRPLFALPVVLVAFSAGIGCSGDDIGRRYKVSGSVTHLGEPVENAQISFHPTDPSGRGATGLVQDGSYFLTTVDEGDGALAGEYVVTIDSRRLDEAQSEAARKKFAAEQGLDEGVIAQGVVPQQFQAQLMQQATGSTPRKYLLPETSDLKATVEPRANQIDLDLVD